MKVHDILQETTINSMDGSIESSKLDAIIQSAMKHFDNKNTIDKVRDIVIDDYADSDISRVTPNDVIEIMQASGFE